MAETVSLSDGEWKLMHVLWSDAPRTMTELVHALSADTGWTKHTVIKMLSRLEDKGAVRHEDGPRAKQYYPAVEQASAVRAETERFLRKVYGGSLGLMMSAMVRENTLTRAELEELSEILKEADDA